MSNSFSISKLLIVIFAIFMAGSAYFLYGSYQDVMRAHSQAIKIVDEQQSKHRLITRMYQAARERSLILLTMHAEDDFFELDDLNQQMSAQARDFIRARQQLEALPMSAEEKDIYTEQQSLVTINAPLQNQVGEFFLEEEREQAEKLMFDRAIPGQRLVLDKITEMLTLYDKNAATTIAEIHESYETAIKDFQILAAVFFVISVITIIFTTYVSRRERRILKDSAEEKAYQASHDPLTGLINRWEFENRLAQLLQQPTDDDTHFVFYLDLDQFKIVNDSCGHHVGDKLLSQVSDVIGNCIRESDAMARIGGDEYGIILESCDLEFAQTVADSIIEAINDFRFQWDRKTFRVGVSIGMVMVDASTSHLEDILKHIDAACYAAKDAGRNRYHLYTEADQELILRKSEMDRVLQLEHAIEQDGFVLYAQPIVPTNQNDTRINYELLLRLKTELGDPIPPGAFLPAAEHYNKMGDIDRWVVTHALSILSDNPQFLEKIGYCSINLSGQSLSDIRFLNFMIDQFSGREALAQKIVLEITETAAIGSLMRANRCISILKGMGIRFALDDFGSGLASFEYLKMLPVEYLKIDGMFVKDITTDAIDRAMVKSIHEIGVLMGKITIAEFVEDEDILNELRTIGVHYAQGYGVGRPIPLEKAINNSAQDSHESSPYTGTAVYE